MSWSTIRKATSTDRENLERAAERFCRRHKLNTDVVELFPETHAYQDVIDMEIDREAQDAKTYGGRHRLAGLWLRIVRRVLESRHADGIAYGYVGFHVD